MKWKLQTKNLFERLRPRFNVMRAMTSEHLGLNYSLLRTFYEARIRLVMDYSAFSIITSNDKIISKPESFMQIS